MRKRFPFRCYCRRVFGARRFGPGGDGGCGRQLHQACLLISIDGMHALDFKNCAHGIAGVNDGKPYCPNLAALGKNRRELRGGQHLEAIGLVSGPDEHRHRRDAAHMGVYYDVAYDRSLDGPAVTTGNGNARPRRAMPTKPPTGYTTEYEEGIDIDQTMVNGGAPGAGLTDGGIASLDPTKMDRDPKKGCAPVLPVGIRAHQHHLRRDSQGRRVHRLVRQASGLLVGGRSGWRQRSR